MDKVKASLAALSVRGKPFGQRLQEGRFYVQGRFVGTDGTLRKIAVDPLGLARWSGSRKLRDTNDSNRQPGPGPGGSTDPMDDGQSPRYVTQ